MKQGKSVLVISHGFQNDYENGFVNGVALNGIEVTQIGSDITDVTKLHHQVNNLNLIGRMFAERHILKKMLYLILYHARLWKHIISTRPDTIHLIGGFRLPFLFGVIEPVIMRLFAGRVLETVHNLLPHNCHTIWNYWVHWLIYRVPNVLVVHTEKMKTGLIEQFGIESDKIIVMHHGVNDPLEHPLEDSEIKQPDINRPMIRMLCFGGVRRYKGYDLLIQAMDGLDDEFGLVISGMCSDMQYSNYLEGTIARNRNCERIIWKPGFVPDEEVNRLFSEADVVVLPYRHIDQSGVLFKALGLGCPVIATDVGSFRDYLTHETGIIVDEISPEALREACLLFRSRKHLYTRNAIRKYAEQFLWSRTVSAVIPIYL